MMTFQPFFGTYYFRSKYISITQLATSLCTLTNALSLFVLGSGRNPMRYIHAPCDTPALPPRVSSNRFIEFL